MELSMNSFSDKLTNFKIKPIEGMTQIQLSNKSVRFVIPAYPTDLEYSFKDIYYNNINDTIDIVLDTGDGEEEEPCLL